MSDTNTLWTAVHDIGLAIGGSIIGGWSAFALAKRQNRDQLVKGHSDRRRELVKEIGTKLGIVLFDFKVMEDRSLDRAFEFVEARKKGKDPEWLEPSGKDMVIASMRTINDLYILAQIDGHGGIAKELLNYLESFKRIAEARIKLLRASHSGTIPDELLAAYKTEKDSGEKVLNRLYGFIREAYNAD